MRDKNLMYTLRKEKKLSMKDIASQIGVNTTTIGKWERGISAPSDVKMVRLAEILEVDIEIIDDIWPRCAIKGCNNIRHFTELCAFHASRRVTITDNVMSEQLKNAQTLGERLRILRTEKSIPPPFIAKTFGVTLDTLCAWEEDTLKPTLMTTLDFAQYYKVTTRFLEKGKWEESRDKERDEIASFKI